MDRELPASSVLVITTDDYRAHLFPDIEALLGSKGIGPNGDRNIPVEFFDRQGYQLAPGFGGGWELLSLTRDADAPNPDLVLSRLRAVVRQAAATIVANPEAVRRAHLTPAEAVAQLPDLHGVDLEGAFRVCYQLFDHPPSNDGDKLHNLIVHGMW
jgi:hypothetical protein